MMPRMTSLILLIALTCVSCQQSESKSEVGFGLVSGNHSVDDPLPDQALTFDTQVTLVNFDRDQEEKMNTAIEILKLVIATDEFREQILNHTYNGAKTFVDNGGLSNAQIYQVILDGAERLNGLRNNKMDVEVELYYESNNIVGYTYPSTPRIWVNKKYFTSYTAAGVAHNLIHEWLHKLGFDHAATWSISRDYSVPYAIGNIVGKIGKKFL